MAKKVTKRYRKGRDFELDVAKQLRAAGFKKTKRMPRSGAIEGLESDLLAPELPLVMELKNQEKWSIESYMEQARRGAKSNNKMPVVIMKKNGLTDPYVTMQLSDWINILQRAFIENKMPVMVGKTAYSKHSQLNRK